MSSTQRRKRLPRPNSRKCETAAAAYGESRRHLTASRESPSALHRAHGPASSRAARVSFDDSQRSCFQRWFQARTCSSPPILRKWRSGGLRQISSREPFKDRIFSSPARGRENGGV